MIDLLLGRTACADVPLSREQTSDHRALIEANARSRARMNWEKRFGFRP